jgi:peptide/nickel transport system permease protein
MLGIVAVLTATAPLIVPLDPINAFVVVDGQRVPLPTLQPPNSEFTVQSSTGPVKFTFLLGTDQLGRDVLSRALNGASFVMSVALLSMSISIVVGVPIGLFSGYTGGYIDRMFSLVMDSIYSFPGLVLAIAIAALLGTGVVNMAIAIAVVYVPSYFRLVRGQVLSVKEQLYVDAIRALGGRRWDILRYYVLPNTIPSIFALLSLNFADAIITEAGLSFLGLGVAPPTPDWGFDLNRGREYFLSGFWWLGAVPGFMIVISVLASSLLGEGLNELLNPKLRKQ